MKQPIAVVMTAMLGFAVCAQSQETASSVADEALGPGTVALLDGQRIPESIFRLYTIGSLQLDPDALPTEARTSIVNNLLFSYALAQEAERAGLTKERRIAAEVEFQRIQTLARFMAERVVQRNPATEAEVRALYEENLPSLERKEFKVRHILVASESDAEDIIDDLDDGDDFARLVDRHSTDSSAQNGGDLGWLTINAIDEPFAAALNETTPGSHYSKPVQTQFGWHVIRVDETRQSTPTIADIQEELVAAINARHLEEFVNSLLESAEVEIVD